MRPAGQGSQDEQIQSALRQVDALGQLVPLSLRHENMPILVEVQGEINFGRPALLGLRRACLSGCAVAFALEYTEELDPGADGLAILVGQDSRDLVQMRHVVRRPCRKQLGESDRPK